MSTEKHTKNSFQEIFQKLKLPLPIYSSEMINSENGKHLWRTIVTLYDGRSFQGDICPNKMMAEISAAVKARIAFEESQKEASYRIAILVDCSLLPNFTDNSNYTIYAFIDDSIKEFPTGILPMISLHPQTHLSMCLGIMLHLESYDEYIIVSTASYAQDLIHMISQPYHGWKPKPARLITNFDDI